VGNNSHPLAGSHVDQEASSSAGEKGRQGSSGGKREGCYHGHRREQGIGEGGGESAGVVPGIVQEGERRVEGGGVEGRQQHQPQHHQQPPPQHPRRTITGLDDLCRMIAAAASPVAHNSATQNGACGSGWVANGSLKGTTHPPPGFVRRSAQRLRSELLERAASLCGPTALATVAQLCSTQQVRCLRIHRGKCLASQSVRALQCSAAVCCQSCTEVRAGKGKLSHLCHFHTRLHRPTVCVSSCTAGYKHCLGFCTHDTVDLLV